MAMLAIILLKVVVFIHSFFGVCDKTKLRPSHFYSHFREGNEKVAMLCGVYNNVLYSYLIDFAGWMVEMR